MAPQDIIAIVTAGATVATAIAVFQGTKRLGKSQARTAFEDDMSREYREILKSIPIAALLNYELAPDKYAESLRAFFLYIDLCNEQVFLHEDKRISEKTWEIWSAGICSNMTLPAFAMAWAEIRSNSKSFDELDRFLKKNCPKKAVRPPTNGEGVLHPSSLAD